MSSAARPPEASLRAGHEVRDVRVSVVVVSLVVLVLLGATLHLLLWELTWKVAPGQGRPGTSPPVVLPGDRPVNDRVRSVPPPRLDPLEPLEADPPTYRPSRPLSPSAAQRPEDLRADRQPALTGYAWVEPGKTARNPISAAMDAVVADQRAKPADPKGGAK
jgi:hypothetical protein